MPADGHKPIRVLIADEQPVVREGVAALLAQQNGLVIVAKVEDGSAALQSLTELKPDVILLDPGASGVETIRAFFAVLEKYPGIRTVVFTASQSEEHVYQAVKAGASGYLLKTSPTQEIVACIQAVARGQNWIPPAVREILARRLAAPELTRRERDVLSAMAEGKSNKEIAYALNVSEGTVKVHVTHILSKMKVGGRTEALAAAAARGLIILAKPAKNVSLAAPIPQAYAAPKNEIENTAKASRLGVSFS